VREIAWAWHAWCRLADSILPWSATPMEGFSKGNWLEQPDKLAIVVPVHENGRWSRPSLRMKAYRRAQQDMEMCNLLVAQGFSRFYLGEQLLKRLGPIRSLPQTFQDEATGVEARTLTPARLESLRQAVRDAVCAGAS
jgi:hypothetical protein